MNSSILIDDLKSEIHMNRIDHGCRDNVVSRRGVLRSLAAGSILFPGILSQLLARFGPKQLLDRTTQQVPC